MGFSKESRNSHEFPKFPYTMHPLKKSPIIGFSADSILKRNYSSACRKGVRRQELGRRVTKQVTLVDVSDFFFFLLGEGKGESEAPGRGIFIEFPGVGGVSPGGEWGRGAGGVLLRIGEFWGGAKYFFSGAEMSTK